MVEHAFVPIEQKGKEIVFRNIFEILLTTGIKSEIYAGSTVPSIGLIGIGRRNT